MKNTGVKKLISLAAAAVLAASLMGCGNNAPQQNVQTESTTESVSVESVQESENKVEESTEVSKESETVVEVEEFVADRSAVFELLSNMNIGWNLGNSLDAWGVGNSLSSETCWSNPKTTQEMIDAIAAKGFNTIRIPITWAEHIGGAPDYKVDAAWMDRVQEVVDYCMKNDMYVIIDTHHEQDFWLNSDPANEEKTGKALKILWTQIAERFKDYDEKLLFEGMNENRIKGSANEWNGGTAAERETQNALNQIFIDAVRATGSNNATRCLIISTVGNNAGYTPMRELDIPEDNNIAVALHMYTPYFFTYDAEGGYDVWDSSRKADIVNAVKTIDKELLKKGVPVIVTEMGAVNKGKDDEVCNWIDDYVSTMNRYGIKCIWWDNGNYEGSGEKFAIFNRKTCTWYNEKIANKLIDMSVTGNQIYPVAE